MLFRHSGLIVPLSNPLDHLNYESVNTKLTFTGSLPEVVSKIGAGLIAKSDILLEGPPGSGKTSIVQELARILNNKYERINLSANSTKEELFGRMIPILVNGKRKFQWQDGPVLRAIQHGYWILFDEINLAAP